MSPTISASPVPSSLSSPSPPISPPMAPCILSNGRIR
jgi:hypothetical protein